MRAYSADAVSFERWWHDDEEQAGFRLQFQTRAKHNDTDL